MFHVIRNHIKHIYIVSQFGIRAALYTHFFFFFFIFTFISRFGYLFVDNDCTWTINSLFEYNYSKKLKKSV